MNNLQLRNEPPNAKCASGMWLCECVYICTSVWVTHQSRASLKMLNRNANGNANTKAIVNANEEYLKGQAERKCWQKVVGNRQRKHRIQMKLKLELELEAAASSWRWSLESSVAMKMELDPSAETDWIPKRININMLVIVCTLKRQQQQHPRRVQLQLPVLPRLLFLSTSFSQFANFSINSAGMEKGGGGRESHTAKQANNQLYPKA